MLVAVPHPRMEMAGTFGTRALTRRLHASGLKMPNSQHLAPHFSLYKLVTACYTILSPLASQFHEARALEDGQFNSLQLYEMVSLPKRLV